jgi:threonine/homoserine/homoserine lactone efflux protein
VDTFLALVAFSFVSSGTPGPNNVLLWASGAEFGFGRTVRHIVGTALGIGLMALAAAAGLGALVTAVPALAIAMKIAGSIYLLYLAVRIAGAHGLAIAELAHPLGIVEAGAFQLINPKAWIFALGAVTTFRLAELPAAAGSLAVASTMMIVVVATAAVWAAAGGAINGLLANDRHRRLVGLTLAALVAATVAAVWI